MVTAYHAICAQGNAVGQRSRCWHNCHLNASLFAQDTTGEKLRSYFENYGVVREAFVSYNRNNGRPRGFGFVVFESPEVAEKVVTTKHTIDRREVGKCVVAVHATWRDGQRRSVR